jgi:hypothetical protein
MGHFAPAMENHGANLVPFAEELDDLILTNLKIVLRGRRAKLHFLQLRATAALSLFVGPLVLLVLVLAVIGYLANRRIGRGRNLHQIQSTFSRQAHGLKRLHDAQLPALFINHPDFASPNALVDADTVRLPEIPLSDKNPLGKNKAPGLSRISPRIEKQVPTGHSEEGRTSNYSMLRTSGKGLGKLMRDNSWYLGQVSGRPAKYSYAFSSF